jgi:DNA-binding NarL/FixJ family response regulator
MSPSRQTVVIADDHPMAREMAQQILESDYHVVATAEDGRGLLDVVAAHTPDIAIVDIRMPVMSGIAAIRRLVQEGCSTILIVMTVYAEPELVEEAFKAGAHGFVVKDRLKQDLKSAILTAQAGGQFVSPP